MNKQSLKLLELFNMELHLLKNGGGACACVSQLQGGFYSFSLSTLQFFHSSITNSNTRKVKWKHKVELSLHSSGIGNISSAMFVSMQKPTKNSL